MGEPVKFDSSYTCLVMEQNILARHWDIYYVVYTLRTDSFDTCPVMAEENLGQAQQHRFYIN